MKIAQVELLFYALRFGVDATATVLIGIQFMRLKYRPLLFLLGTMLLFTIGNLYDLLIELLSLGDSLVVTTDILSFQILAFLLLLLFFQAFHSASVISRRNLVLAILVAIIFTLMRAFSVIIYSLREELFPDLSSLFSLGEIAGLSAAARTLVRAYLYTMVGALVLLFYQFGAIIVLLRRLRKKARIRKVRRLLTRMHWGAVVLMVGAIVTTAAPYIGGPLLIAGIILLIFVYLRSGVLLLQEEALRYLIVMTPSGIPLYAYNFRPSLPRETEPATPQVRTGQEMLFSGALKAISSILAQLTGSDEIIREVVLDNAVLHVQQSPNGNLASVLVADHSSKMLVSSLSQFAVQIENLAQKGSPNQPLEGDLREKANVCARALFGEGLATNTNSSNQSIG